YPNARLLFRCAAAGCTIRTELPASTDRTLLRQCLARAPQSPDAGIDGPLAIDAGVGAAAVR
ncbi:MAG: hypothetical protein R3B06_31825, partial [Kofleriaceae bacterium]